MTEGMSLFLSHELPAVVFYSEKEGLNWHEISRKLTNGIWRITNNGKVDEYFNGNRQ